MKRTSELLQRLSSGSDSAQASFAVSRVSKDEAHVAAMEGYVVKEDESVEEESSHEKALAEDAELYGDVDKLTPNQKTTVLMLNEARIYPRLKVKQVSLSFSGASVFFFSPSRKDGTPMPSSVLKLDYEECVREEIEKTREYGKLFGLTTPKVKQTHFLDGASANDPCAVMQIDLAGGMFGLPEFANAPPVHTFASVIETEMRMESAQVDVVPLVNEALERRMHGFTMSRRHVIEIDLAKDYKIVRFVGHGVLNRAAEGKKRSAKNPALGAGFLNPADIDDLDPQGEMLTELSGKRTTLKHFFETLVSNEAQLKNICTRKVVMGLSHGDLHGGNLLLDSQGLVWLIDFATVEDNTHVLKDLSKFLAACLFLYLHDSVEEEVVNNWAKLLATTPDATTALPVMKNTDGKSEEKASVLSSLLARLRHCMCLYEVGDDAPNNDGLPFAVALFSWSARMLSYSEPTLYQKRRAVYFSIASAQRLMREAKIDVGPTATEWINNFLAVWEGQKGRRLSTSATQLQKLRFEFEVEFPRYLSQVGSTEAWTTDLLTREKVHVLENAIAVSLKFSGKVIGRPMILTPLAKRVVERLNTIAFQLLPDLEKAEVYYGRLIIIGGSGTGKTMMTKQFFSEVSQHQLKEERETQSDSVVLLPVRVPLVEISRQLEAEPDSSLVADPVSDLLVEWVNMKYGSDSHPTKLISELRMDCQKMAQRATGRGSGRVSSLSQSATGRVSFTEETEEGEELPPEKVGGMLLLSDSVDEASSQSTNIFTYLASLTTQEPSHVHVVTTRPSVLTGLDTKALFDMSFVSCLVCPLSWTETAAIVKKMLSRLKDPDNQVDRVLEILKNPQYFSLVSVPITLSLLVHVLRKYTGITDKEMGKKTEEVLKLTDVYQRALKLMVHQSDAAKFALRDGRKDRELARKLEMLKSPRARKLFQTISWHCHGVRNRSFHWADMPAICGDVEMFSIMRETFEQGRIPVFEDTSDNSSNSKSAQFQHLSFQELMAAEYAAAIVQHGYSTTNMEAYANHFLSNSSLNQERDRLSEAWWSQVWMNTSELLDEAPFAEWCKTLAMDEDAILKIGRVVQWNTSQGFGIFDIKKKRHQRYQHALSVGQKDLAPHFDLAYYYRVVALDWQKNTVQLKYQPVFPGDGYGIFTPYPKNKMDADEPPIVCVLHSFGVCALAVDCVERNYPDCLEGLLLAKVHVGCCHRHRHGAFDYTGNGNLWGWAVDHGRWDCLQKVVNAKGEVAANELSYTLYDAMRFKSNKRWNSRAQEYWKIVRLNLGMEVLEDMKPSWILDQAKAGTLKMNGEVDPNFMDQANQLTPLMVAAAAGHHSMVDELIKQQADVHAQTSEGLTALSFAADYGFTRGTTRCFQLLLEAGANIHQQIGKTYKREMHRLRGLKTSVAHAVCRIGDDEKLDLLLKAKMDVNVVNELGTPPLFEAFSSGNEVCVQRLIAAKASVNHRMHTARWPNWKESMCIIAFADMHGEKDLSSIKMAREMLNLEWNHHFPDGQVDVPTFPTWILVSRDLQKQASFDTIQWCLDSAFSLQLPTVSAASGRGVFGPLYTWLHLFVQCEHQATHGFLLFKMFDQKVTPQVEMLTGSQQLSFPEHEHIIALNLWPGALAQFAEIWNNYQILLAARDVE